MGVGLFTSRNHGQVGARGFQCSVDGRAGLGYGCHEDGGLAVGFQTVRKSAANGGCGGIVGFGGVKL